MKKVLTYLVLLSGTVFVLLNGNQKAQASQLNFNVEAIIPENQVDKNKTYYDLRIEPGKTQDLKLMLHNSTDKDVSVELTAEAATTNLNGVVEYGKTKAKRDSTLKTSIGEIVTLSEENPVIPAKGSKEITLTVKMPTTDFDGVLAGGITVKETSPATDKATKETKGMAIENRYSYVVALVLHGKNETIPSELKLNKVKATQVNVRNVISANLQNTKAKYLNQLSVDAKITKKGENKTLYSVKKEQMQMAPNSNFNLPIPLNGAALKSGKYTLKVKADSQGNTWNFTRDFNISAEEAKKLNEQDVSIEKDNTWLYVLIGVILLAALLILFYLIMRKRKKEKERLERELKRLKSKRAKKKRKTSELEPTIQRKRDDHTQKKIKNKK
ncbi:DUF916 and DUF3324 domain-containing protein [Carnobacterium maltaromaticum]|uniref:DUF916 and DUF3324 domain-containing protein n=1 Tax=Carnobacterium maltaromaticum TaxID=2751 RepID=A0AAW9KBR8_CARML|nr:DUF916 and DUF3324 domain-containing protein [Carnobacterium maltaromaticum]MDZ5759628.1 DUF916 and DUF3324 domain-containing protein [Carnobacterium maltaromaticum]